MMLRSQGKCLYVQAQRHLDLGTLVSYIILQIGDLSGIQR